MDQKHGMLYPPIEPGMGSIDQDQRMSAIGLPTEAPPSYDMAMGAPSAPSSNQISLHQSTSSGVNVIPYVPPQVNLSHHETPTVTVAPNAGGPTHSLRLGPDACSVICPSCNSQQNTRVTYTSNTYTHLCALVLCMVGFCCCLCFVPYCMKSCRTGNHYCKKCNTYLGAYKQKAWK